jgi:uncharacterized protein with GYD domain
MPQNTDFTTFVSLVNINDPTIQNVQELAALWGEIRQEFEEAGAEVIESYAVLGEVDFIVIFEAPSTEVGFKSGVILERHGMDAQTMEITPTEEFAQLVTDI